MNKFFLYVVLILTMIGCSKKDIRIENKEQLSSQPKQLSPTIRKIATTGYIIDSSYLKDAKLYMFTFEDINKQIIVFFHKNRLDFDKKTLLKVLIEGNYMISLTKTQSQRDEKEKVQIQPKPIKQKLKKRTLSRKNRKIKPPIEEKIDLF